MLETEFAEEIRNAARQMAGDMIRSGSSLEALPLDKCSGGNFCLATENARGLILSLGCIKVDGNRSSSVQC